MLKLVAFCLVFIPIVVIAIGKPNYAESTGSRIIGGKEASITEYPYQAAVEINEKFKCGGSIIARRWILTDATCLWQGYASPVKVRIGTSFLLEGGQVINVQGFARHSYYNSYTGDNDIALLLLEEPIPLSESAQIVRLPDNGNATLDGRMGTLTAWGATTKLGSMSSVLRAVDVPVVNLDVCKETYNDSNWRVSDRMLCAGPWEGGKGMGDGDGGGPFVVDSVLVGIASWSSRDRAEPEHPGVYTDVGAFRDWITENTGI
ncbi:hypothetical protein NQ315_011548 [Exocentrus adspersus]|uniref:Peptidase S1 domain-containing protein n=1 Tax=Exocentrus adspersus TaxID=1586481 RepID=A0AAV8VUL7_9CUCU|nr:hypothetical protein NQ315_011548 [Exocentrus adspersus]